MKKIAKVNRIELIDWSNDSESDRAFVKWVEHNFNVYIDFQDDKRTLKIFVTERELSKSQ